MEITRQTEEVLEHLQVGQKVSGSYCNFDISNMVYFAICYASN